MSLARWPKEGWSIIADVPQSGELVFNGDPNGLKSIAMILAESILIAVDSPD